MIELKRMLHAVGAWRPTLAAFPETSVDTAEMRALQKTDKAQYDKLAAAIRQNARDLQLYDEEAIAAVDKFRAEQGLNYQGTPAGMVDARVIEALRAAYLKKR